MRAAVCNEIRKKTRDASRAKKTARIGGILANFKGQKQKGTIKKPFQKQAPTSVADRDGSKISGEEGVAEVFRRFYEDLYRQQGASQRLDGSLSAMPLDDGKSLEPFSFEELRQALRGMKNGKAKDEKGVIAEMVKNSSQEFLTSILELFNDILLRKSDPPAAWKTTKLIVIFKKGDATLPKNYRPIAILPILYKVFSRLLCQRLTSTLMQKQDADQAAYRKDFSTQDHLFTVAILIERSYEHNFPLWMAAVDFEKAFDMVRHDSLWVVLSKQGLPVKYIHLLKELYRGQAATVQAGTRSKPLSVEQGVKQGDPISALLFIAVMQDLCGRLKVRWAKANARRKGTPFGIPVGGASENLTNLRFADDVLLISQSQTDIVKMLNDFAKHASEYGLKLNFDKTKILTWGGLSNATVSVPVGSRTVDVLSEMASEKYLGAKICLHDARGAEFGNRIAAA